MQVVNVTYEVFDPTNKNKEERRGGRHRECYSGERVVLLVGRLGVGDGGVKHADE